MRAQSAVSHLLLRRTGQRIPQSVLAACSARLINHGITAPLISQTGSWQQTSPARYVSTVRSQLAMLPEYQQSAADMPAGSVLVGVAPAQTATAVKVLALAARLGEIVSSFPEAMRSSFDPLMRRRQLQVAEGCGALAVVHQLAASPHTAAVDASLTLAQLRAALLCTGIPGARCLAAADASKSALAAAIALQSAAQTPTAASAADGKGSATLSVAAARVLISRLHALACLISLAHPAAAAARASPLTSAPASTPLSSSSSAESAAKPASGPAASDFVGLAAHLHDEAGRVLAAVARTAAGARTDPRVLAAISGAAACAHASALRNVAAAHLAAAAAHASADDAAAAGSAAGSATGPEIVAAFLADAHSALEAALAAATAATEERQHLRRDAGSDPAASAASAAAPIVSLLRRGDADLTLHRAHIHASLAEVTLLSALWTAWTAPAAATAAASSDAKDSGPPATSASLLFVLPLELQDALAGPLRTAAAAAEAAVKLFDEVASTATGAEGAGTGSVAGSGGSVPASGAAPSAAPSSGGGKRLRWADYGRDVSGGIARPLRLLSLLQMLGRRPVMAEGLLRSALEHGEGDVVWRNAHGQGVAWPAPAGAPRYAHLPVLQRAGIGASWLAYGHLMQQWEKREEEGKRALATAAPLLEAASAMLPAPAGSKPATSAPASADAKPSAVEQRRSFVRSFLVGAAAGTLHVGSVSLALEDGLEEAMEAAETSSALA